MNDSRLTAFFGQTAPFNPLGMDGRGGRRTRRRSQSGDDPRVNNHVMAIHTRSKRKRCDIPGMPKILPSPRRQVGKEFPNISNTAKGTFFLFSQAICLVFRPVLVFDLSLGSPWSRFERALVLRPRPPGRLLERPLRNKHAWSR